MRRLPRPSSYCSTITCGRSTACALASRVAGAQGTVIFASAYLEPDRWSAFVGDGPFAEPAPAPAMSWK